MTALDLDQLAALREVAPALTLIHEIMRDGSGARAWSPYGEAFYDACRTQVPGLIQAARERDALRAALQGLMGAAWHDNDCAHVTDREPCDCGFAAAYAVAEKALAQETPDASR